MFRSMFGAARAAVLLLALLSSLQARSQEIFSPWVGSFPDSIDYMLSLAQLKDGELAVDLGSGDGRIVIAAALTHRGVRGWGVDIDQKLVDLSNSYAEIDGVSDRVRFVHGDVFDADVSKVDVIFMWLLPELMRLLRPKLLLEARPGTRVVSHLFDMGSWQADETHKDNQSVRMWVVPAKVEGYWRWTMPLDGVQRSYTVALEQNFQHIEGVIRMDEHRRELREAKLRGDRVSFTMVMTMPGLDRVTQEFSGLVKGDRIEGTARVLVPIPSEGDDDVNPGMKELAVVPWVATRAATSSYFDREIGRAHV